MSKVLESVDKHTLMVGQNRLELLLFKLGQDQYYGINVFKVREVVLCPELTTVSHGHPAILGMTNMRGVTIPVIDLAYVTEEAALSEQDKKLAIVTEYNRNIQAFVVSGVDRIVNTNWEDIHSPPAQIGEQHYLTAVTQIDERIIQILDVEGIFDELNPSTKDIERAVISEEHKKDSDLIYKTIRQHGMRVMIIDDSLIARKQLQNTLTGLGLEVDSFTDGKKGLQHLEGMVSEGENPLNHYAMIISDIEMPEMDGYTFVTRVRENPQLNSLYVMLHTSLSGVFNEAMIKKVGADRFLAKFSPDDLVQAVHERMKVLYELLNENE